MLQDVAQARAPHVLKRCIAPLTALLGVPLMLRENADTPVWPDPGLEAHTIVHREFPELGPCPHLAESTIFPQDGLAPTKECPLGLTARHFAITIGDRPWGVVVLGPYFTREADRNALFGRSRAADAALAVLPALDSQRQAHLISLCGELAALATLAGSAAKASAAKETFLANVRHELRTPLNGIMGMLSLVLQGELASRQRQFLELAMDASNQLLALVNDLLEMSRVATGRLLLAEEPFGLRQEIEPLLSAWAEDAARRGLSFAADIDADVPEEMWGDASRLKQVLLNLVQNALRFTERGSIGVRVSRLAERSDADRVTLLFSVRDTGIGIAPDRQNHIFDRFAIGEDFLGKRQGRLGLGLAIAKEMVEKMGGSLDLESVPGLGSLFTFTVVLRLSAQFGPSLPQEQATPGRGAVVLFVEDEPVSRLLVRRILENQGYTAVEAGSDQDFLDILRRQPVDMTLVDIKTPRLDALDLIGRIRAGREPGIAPDLPFVALTPPDCRTDCQAAPGLSGCVTKPVTRQELLAAVEQALAGRPPTSHLKPTAV